LARWTARDPLGSLDSPNLYSYSLDSPVEIFDPLGLWGSEVHGPYNELDECFSTSPWVQPWLHFRELNEIEKDLNKAIRDCDYKKFKRFMHEGQDYFSHYKNGYRWWLLGHVPQSACAKVPRYLNSVLPQGARIPNGSLPRLPDSPSNFPTEYQETLIWTQEQEQLWKDNYPNCDKHRS
ncbi:MAG: hypothetical protein K1Y02_02805, partial [Candidatus Hydrogenedentes bacterium]|nr:hypothetical protein [Candidatus Hydrogenedentota bacterium]